MSLIRACAHCEGEFGILTRADETKTHGLCRRHFVALLESAAIPQADIQKAIAQAGPAAFCPDLSLEVAA